MAYYCRQWLLPVQTLYYVRTPLLKPVTVCSMCTIGLRISIWGTFVSSNSNSSVLQTCKQWSKCGIEPRIVKPHLSWMRSVVYVLSTLFYLHLVWISDWFYFFTKPKDFRVWGLLFLPFQLSWQQMLSTPLHTLIRATARVRRRATNPIGSYSTRNVPKWQIFTHRELMEAIRKHD
jgi:hypothetical protein